MSRAGEYQGFTSGQVISEKQDQERANDGRRNGQHQQFDGVLKLLLGHGFGQGIQCLQVLGRDRGVILDDHFSGPVQALCGSHPSLGLIPQTCGFGQVDDDVGSDKEAEQFVHDFHRIPVGDGPVATGKRQ